MQFQQFPLPPGNHELTPAVYQCRVESVLPELGLAKLVLALGPPHMGALARHEATNLAVFVTIDSVGEIARTLAELAMKLAAMQQPSNTSPDGLQTRVGQPRPGKKRQ
jgi:hypothetical protein